MQNNRLLPEGVSITQLSNGLRVITESMTGVRSVSIGCWFRTGSRDETDPEAGVSHFLEHLLFKQTENLTSRQIADAFDVMGAESNAFTAKDHTCFYARTLDSDLLKGLELLAEMLQRPAFLPEEIDTERQVVIEEINRSEDDPDSAAAELFTQRVFSGHSLGLPILGSRSSIGQMERSVIHDYWQRRYGPKTMVLSVAGLCQHEQVVELAERLFGDWEGGPTETLSTDLSPIDAFSPSAGIETANRDTKQAHLILGGIGLHNTDDRRWAFGILNGVIGGGMSSRLFQSIREERGLAYAVGSFGASYADIGMWGVHAGTTTSFAPQVLDLIRTEINQVMSAGITHEELNRQQSHLRGSLALSLEDPNSRMVRNGRAESLGIPHLSMDERIAKIDGTTLEEVQSVAVDVLSAPKVLGAVGNFQVDKLTEYVEW